MDFYNKHRSLVLALCITFGLYLAGLVATEIGLAYTAGESALDQDRKPVPATNFLTPGGKQYELPKNKPAIIYAFNYPCEAWCNYRAAKLLKKEIPKDWQRLAVFFGSPVDKALEHLAEIEMKLPVVLDPDKSFVDDQGIFVFTGDGNYARTVAYDMEMAVKSATAIVSGEDHRPFAAGEAYDRIRNASYWRYHRAVGSIFVFVVGFLFLLLDRRNYREYKPLLWITGIWILLYGINNVPPIRLSRLDYGLSGDLEYLAIYIHQFVYGGYLFTGLYIWAGYKFLRANLRNST